MTIELCIKRLEHALCEISDLEYFYAKEQLNRKRNCDEILNELTLERKKVSLKRKLIEGGINIGELDDLVKNNITKLQKSNEIYDLARSIILLNSIKKVRKNANSNNKEQNIAMNEGPI